jgi:hypothetical protein
LNFAVQPPDSLIVIGGQRVTSASASLEPGVYSISIQREGYATWSKDVTVEAGETQAIGVALARVVVSTAQKGEPELEPDGPHVPRGEADADERWHPHEGVRLPPRSVGPLPRVGEPVAVAAGQPPGTDAAGSGADTPSPGHVRSDHGELPDAAPPGAGIDAGIDAGKLDATPALPPDAAPASAPRVPTVSSSAVTKLSGTMPALHVRGGGDLSDVVAKLCIDERGTVTSAQAVRAAKEIAGMVERELRGWRYKPYLAQGKPSPACFPVQMRVVVVPPN